jgi:hypothetical protein
MALQSSGAISISDIKTELGSSSNSLATLSVAAGKTQPHSMSEFYGYSAAQPLYYWDLNNDIKWANAQDVPLGSTSESFTASLWIRPQWAASDLNLIIFDLTPSGTTSTANRFFLQYDYGGNFFNAMYRSNATNFNANWTLHGNNSVTATGAASTNYWTAANRGDTNSDGFIHLVLVYNATQSTPATAFKLYWNDREMTSVTSASSGTRSAMGLDEVTFCGNDHNTAGSRIADYMYMHFWDVALKSTDITSMYNSGTPKSASSAGVTSNLIFGDTSTSVPSVSDPDDSNNYTFETANNQSLVLL